MTSDRQLNKTPEQKKKDAENVARWRAANPENALAISRRYTAKHKDEIRERQRNARQTNLEKAREKDRKRYREVRGEKQRAILRERYATEEGYKRAVLERNLGRKYGLDWDGWGEIFEAQEDKCAGCSAPLREGRGTHVDHCHTSDRVRGLLCSKCNRALGCVGDSVKTLERLVVYLRRCPTLGGVTHSHEGLPIDPIGVAVTAMVEARRKARRE